MIAVYLKRGDDRLVAEAGLETLGTCIWRSFINEKIHEEERLSMDKDFLPWYREKIKALIDEGWVNDPEGLEKGEAVPFTPKGSYAN